MSRNPPHFGLRKRPPTPAVRPFDLMPRLRAMLDQANLELGQPFRGVTGGGMVAGLFPLAKTGISLASVMEAARSFLATLTADQRKAACFTIGDEAWRGMKRLHRVARSGLASLGAVAAMSPDVSRAFECVAELVVGSLLTPALFVGDPACVGSPTGSRLNALAPTLDATRRLRRTLGGAWVGLSR